MNIGEELTLAQFNAQIRHGWTEAQFQKQAIILGIEKGWRVYHTPDGAHMRKVNPTGAGYPDMEFLRPPRLIKAELKKVDGRATKAQSSWLRDYARVPGVEAYIWDPDDWDKMEQILA